MSEWRAAQSRIFFLQLKIYQKFELKEAKKQDAHYTKNSLVWSMIQHEYAVGIRKFWSIAQPNCQIADLFVKYLYACNNSKLQ